MSRVRIPFRMSVMCPTVAIVGGGFSGAATAYHLARLGVPCNILVFEPRATLGAGLAYDTDEPVHRINVPANKMSLEPDDGDHFARWLASDGGVELDAAAQLPDGRIFPRRKVFSWYVAAQLWPYLHSGAIRHVRAMVAQVSRSGARWRIVPDDGAAQFADIVVVATSHPAPTLPAALAGIAGDRRVIADPLLPGALDAVAPDARVLVVGTGLTMADTVAALDRRGHTGPILAVSRRGQRSHGHAIASVADVGNFAENPATTALALLRRVRGEVFAAARRGEPSHGVINAVRKEGAAVWAALPHAERARLLRHLRPFWDTHRFRIAPQVEAVLERRLARGTLAVAAARPVRAAPTPAGLMVDLASRGGGMVTEVFDTVVITTGPGHGTLLSSQRVLAALAGEGCLRADPLGLGLDCAPDGRAIGSAGPQDDLLVAGPLARGTVGELVGVPEVTTFCRVVARTIAAELGRRSASALTPAAAPADLIAN